MKIFRNIKGDRIDVVKHTMQVLKEHHEISVTDVQTYTLKILAEKKC